MTVQHRLAGGFALIILALILAAVLGHLTVQGMLLQGESTNSNMAMITELTQREVDHLLWVAKVRDFIADEQASQLQVEADPHKCGFGKWYYGGGAEKLGGSFPTLQPILQQLAAPHAKLHQSAEAIRQGEKSQAAVLYAEQTVPALAEVQPLLRQLRDGLQKEVEQRRVETAAHLQNRSRLIDISIVSAGILTVVIGFLTYRGVVGIVGHFCHRMTKVSGRVAGSSQAVAAGAHSLAEGATEQAASAEETASSLDEIAAMTRQNADNAGQADTLMRDTNLVVNRAVESMSALTGSMQGIIKASEETSKIIRTIDEIAFQTNLLALNAAVEAARAGEAGAGFAVVADEVRNLAMRAAEAAKNTSAMIDDTVKKIGEGSSLVTLTGGAFNEVASSSAKAAALVGEIAVASGEQAQGLQRLNQAMNEMDTVVHRNAANAEESAAAAEELNGMALEMEASVEELVAVVGIRNRS